MRNSRPAPRLAAFAPLAVSLGLLSGCGPGIAVGLVAGSSSSDGPPALTLAASEILPPPGFRVQPCDLQRTFAITTNREDARLSYRIDYEVDGERKAGRETRPVPDGAGSVTLDLWPRRNVVVFTADVATDSTTTEIAVDFTDRAADAFGLRLATARVQGQDVTLSWDGLVASSDYEIYYREVVDGALFDARFAYDRLDGTGVAAGPSPIRRRLDAVDGTRIELTLTMPKAATNYEFAVRDEIGCMSPVITAHTRPARVAVDREAEPGIAFPPGATFQRDVLPPVFMDLGSVPDGPRFEPDGLEDVVLVDDTGRIWITPNCPFDDGGGPCPGAGLGMPIDTGIVTAPDARRVHVTDLDGDGIDDLVVATRERIVPIAGNPANAWSLDRNPADDIRADATIGFTSFDDVVLGDFDGDSFVDFAALLRGAAGVELAIYYGLSDANGVASRRWTPATRLGPASLPTDGTLLVADLNGDGTDDLVHAETRTATTASIRSLIFGPRGLPPIARSSTGFSTDELVLRWDRCLLVDVDHNGTPDLAAIRRPPMSNRIEVVTIANVDDGAGAPVFDPTTRRRVAAVPDPVDRVHLLLADVTADDADDLVLRTTFDSNSTTRVVVLPGTLHPVTGRLDWRDFGAPLPNLDNRQARAATPRHGAIADLDVDTGAFGDTVPELVGIVDDELVVVRGRPDRQWDRPSGFAFGGSLLADVPATTVRAVTVERPAEARPTDRGTRVGDLLLGIERERSLIHFFAAHLDRGRPSGGFTLDRLDTLPDVELFDAIDSDPHPATDFLVSRNGRLGQLEYEEGSPYTRFVEINVPFTVSATVRAATFDADRDADAFVFVADPTAPLRGVFALASTRRNSLPQPFVIPGTPFNAALDPTLFWTGTIDGDRWDEIVLATATEVVVQRFVVTADPTAIPPADRRPRYRDEAVTPVDLGASTSATAANFTARSGQAPTRSRTLVLGAADEGRLQAFDVDPTQTALQLDSRPARKVGPDSRGAVLLHAADVDLDGIDDLILLDVERGPQGRVRSVLEVRRTGTSPIAPNHPQLKGSGLDPERVATRTQCLELPPAPANVAVPFAASALTTALVNDDPYPDVLVTRGREVLVFYGVGDQVAVTPQ